MRFAIRGRTALLVGGGAAALAAGLAFAWTLSGSHRGEASGPPPASTGGLVIDPNAAPEAPFTSTKVLRCFVGTQFVGDFTLADCAKRNGVATDALDVGIDVTGALAASEQGGAAVTPLPPVQPPKPEAKPEAAAPTVNAGPAGVCWRYDGGWRRLPVDLTLAACAQVLFAGRCEKPGGASYGRWEQQTLRLTPGRVEISPDNRSFRTLVEQGPGCSLPPPA